MRKSQYPGRGQLSEEKHYEVDSVISVRNLSLFYDSKRVVDNISLEVKRGCVTGIIGPSGCGKSSFIHSLNRMIDLNFNARVDGEIDFNGMSIFDSKTDLTELRKKIGIVFQEPIPLPLSIIKNIELPLKEHRFDCVRERAVQSLRDVGLWDEVKDKLQSPASELSGGQKQRLCLARTIALGPEVILMDEPCSSLDPFSTGKVEELIHRLKGRFSILIVTHNLGQARRVCDYVSAFWYDEINSWGQVLATGSCIEIFEHSENKVLREYVGGLKG